MSNPENGIKLSLSCGTGRMAMLAACQHRLSEERLKGDFQTLQSREAGMLSGAFWGQRIHLASHNCGSSKLFARNGRSARR
ncbi:MAG: hypothetical protein ABWZ83_08210, partial [Mesorhizobium sp.]